MINPSHYRQNLVLKPKAVVARIREARELAVMIMMKITTVEVVCFYSVVPICCWLLVATRDGPRGD